MARRYKTYTPQELTIWIKELIARNDMHAFYICKAWLHLRAEALKEQNYECQVCKGKGKFEPADTVHHIKPVRRYPWLALNKRNLMCLCEQCHYEVHHPTNVKWDDERW